MNFDAFYTRLMEKRFYVFSLGELERLWPDEERSTLKKALYRWENAGRIGRLKKGHYELTYPQDLNIPDLFIANRIYQPSYISLETALSFYSLIPEVAMAVTSITTKPTRRFENRHGLFTYRSIQSENFSGYSVQKHLGFEILMAEPEKALADFWYFNRKALKHDAGQSIRLDKAAVKRLDQGKLKSYARLFGLPLEELLNAGL